MTTDDAAAARVAALLPEHLPLSPAQRSIWFLDKAGSGGAYNIARARRLTGPLDLDLLEESHRFVVDRHEILRTRYVEIDGVPAQVVDPPGTCDFEIVRPEDIDLTGYLEHEAERSFDLSADRMWRTRVIPSGPEDHILLDVVHHIAADGWSVPGMRREAGAYYAAAREGRLPEMPAPVQYREVIGGIDPDRLGSRLAYWETVLEGVSDGMPLPTDRPRPALRSSEGFWARATIPGVSPSDLERLAGALDATRSMVGLALFAATLARYSRTSDVVVGLPVTGRTDPGADGVVGPFFNSLPIRLRVEPEMSLRELVTQARDRTLDALDNEIPFDEIVRGIDPPRIPGQTPIFQAMFQHRDAAFREGYDLPGIVETAVELTGRTAKFDLLLEVADTGDGVELSLNLSRDLFDEPAGDRLVGGLAEFGRQALVSPELPLRDSSMSSPAEVTRLTGLLADNERPLPTVESLALHYEKQAAGRGAEVAIVAGQRITHDQLLTRSREIENSLEAAGVKARQAVAVLMERSPAMVATVLAVNRMGAVYVPIDPEYPEERIRRIVEISGAVVTVERAATARWGDVSVGAAGGSTLHDQAGQPVYIMFTSGSTGDPKGVVVGEEAVLRLVTSPDYVAIGPGDVVAHLSNVAFDAATFEIWGPLLNGAAMAIIGKEAVLSPDDLEMTLEEKSVTTMFVTTALFNLIARQKPGLFAGVRDVLFGGERCEPTSVRKVIEAGPPRRLVHVYGPTETTTFATWHEVGLDRPVPNNVPIGGPITNTRLYVLDGWGSPVPQGLVGELYIGGPGVALGYVGDPADTAARFSADPFSRDPWGRMYRTGDLVRLNDRAQVEFLGRADRQLKLRGFRIEPAEIEAALRSHPAVGDAVVRLVDDGDPRLVAWAATGATQVQEAELKRHVGARLPGFMVPAVIVPLEEIPIGATGKIDAGLLATSTPHPGAEKAIGETESKVVRLFEDVLGVEGIGRTDDFFDLGGHSIRAVELVALIEKRFGRRMGVMEMMEGPTPAEIAARIDAGEYGVLERRLVTMADGRGDPLFVFHHPSGTVQAYSDMVRSLPDGVRVIGVNASGVDGTIQPSENLEEMAEEYAALIGSAHQGVFRLIGHSLGGLLAWETARQLRLAGREVEFLGLIDTQLPRRLGLSEFIMGLPGSIHDLARSTYRRLHRLGGDLRWGSKRWWYQSRRRPLPADLARIGLVRASSKAFDSYRPSPIGTGVVYFLATGAEGRGGGRIQAGWRELSSHLEVVRVPGMHSGPQSILMPPNVAVLANEVATRLPPGSDNSAGEFSDGA